MKWINYHHLIYFKTIANQGGISKASEVLKVGQPALSSQLKSFEEFLGVKLFERKSRKLILTEAGKVTLDYANKIGDLGQELMQVIDSKGFTKDIKLTVGALDGIPKNLISDVVDFAHKKTGCFLSINEGHIDELLRQLETHQIEIIISDHDLPALKSSKIFSQKIFKGGVVACASPKFKHLKKDFPNSLNGVSTILPSSHSKMRQDIENFLDLNKIRPNIIGQTQDTSLQKILAMKGDGVIFLPEFSIKQYVQGDKLVKLGALKHVNAEYYFIYSKRVIGNPALDIILEKNFYRSKA